MGTHSVTRFINENGQVVARLFRHSDGYPAMHGKELKATLSRYEIVDGITFKPKSTKEYANGIECLAATAVAAFKQGIGSFYLIGEDTDASYTYDIYTIAKDNNPKQIYCKLINGKKVLYDGVLSEMPCQ